MSYNGSGTFSVYTPGNPVVTGTTISSTAFNATMSDFATGLSTSIAKDGQTTVTAAIKFYAGTVSLPGIVLSTDTASGFYRIGANNWGWSGNGSKVLDMSASGFSVTGTLSASGLFTPSAGILGTATNDSASAGNVGEYVSSVVTATNFPATNVYGDLTSISLTAGDWDVTGIVDSTLNGATMTVAVGGVSTTSGNSATGLTVGSNFFNSPPPTSAYDVQIVIPAYRISLSATTTVYLKYRASYSAGTPQATGRLSARRVR